MLKNHFKIAVRNFMRQKGYTFINVAGLAIGIACCLLILLYVQDEVSYDRFHERSDRIVRVALEARGGDGDWRRRATTFYQLAPLLETSIPHIERTVRLAKDRALLSHGDRQFMEDNILLADSTVFDAFTIPFVRGNPETAFQKAYSAVLTEAAARKYFGDEDPIGQTISRNNEHDFEVTGIVEALPPNSHFHFDVLFSLASTRGRYSREAFESLGAQWLYTYLLLERPIPADALEKQVNTLMAQHIPPDLPVEVHLTVQPLTAIHLRSQIENELEPNGNITYLYIFGLIAGFILLIACINFMNLATARATNRAREVGVRKMLGAPRAQLIHQFLSESVLLSLAAIVLAVGLAALALPLLNAASGKTMTFGAVIQPQVVLVLLGIGLVVGVIAGSYPALFLSAFQPARVLKGKLAARGARGAAWLRQGLVVFQFGITIVLIIGTLVVYSQLRYMQSKDPGFDRKQVVSVTLPPSSVGASIPALKEAFAQAPGVVSVSAASNAPPELLNSWWLRLPGTPAEQQELIPWIAVDYDYLETLGLELVVGRNFSEDFPADEREAILLNEAAVSFFKLDDPVGQRFHVGSGFMATEEAVVIGVVKDFHQNALHEKIRPAFLYLRPLYQQMLVHVEPGRFSETLAELEAAWKAQIPSWPFEYAFLDDRFDALYRAEQRLGRLFGYFAGLAIFIACLGLFGLAAFTAEQRTKEIGVRKVLGASVPHLVGLLAKQFALLVLIGFAVAVPVAYVALTRWLDGFAYRVDISPTIFLISGLAALGVAWLTISYQAIKAALSNPVKTLRYE